MPAAGDPVFASDVLRARPKPFWDAASSALPASSTNVAVPGISIAFTTETANADLTLWWTIDADTTGANTTLFSARPRIVGSGGAAAYGTVDAPIFAVAEMEVTTDRASTGNSWSAPLGPAGTYTITLIGTTGALGQLNVYTTVTALLQEQFA